jgi:hypothetical protein
MDSNEASIKLCVRNGMRYTHTETHKIFNKRQMFHEITREEWWARNRPNKPITDTWGGKEVGRWWVALLSG